MVDLSSINVIRHRIQAAALNPPQVTLTGVSVTLHHGKVRVRVNHDVRLLIWLLFLALLLVGGSLFVTDLIKNIDIWADFKAHESKTAMLIGGIFTLFSIVFTALQIWQHWQNWRHPSQKYIVRILLLVPIYGFASWASLVVLRFGTWLEFVRGASSVCVCVCEALFAMCTRKQQQLGIYEAYVIYCFLMLLTKYLGGHQRTSTEIGKEQQIAWPPPLCCLHAVSVEDQVRAARFLRRLKYAVLQYTIFQSLAMSAALCLHVANLYDDGVFDFRTGYIYIVFIRNATQVTFALSLTFHSILLQPLCLNYGFACFRLWRCSAWCGCTIVSRRPWRRSDRWPNS